MSHLLSVFCILLISNSLWASPAFPGYEEPQFIDGEIVVEVNDAGEIVTLSEGEYYEMTGLKFLEHLAGFFNFRIHKFSITKPPKYTTINISSNMYKYWNQ